MFKTRVRVTFIALGDQGWIKLQIAKEKPDMIRI